MQKKDLFSTLYFLKTSLKNRVVHTKEKSKAQYSQAGTYNFSGRDWQAEHEMVFDKDDITSENKPFSMKEFQII